MLAKAGMIAIPLTLVILLLVFGSVVAAAVPLLLAITAVFTTTALIAIPSQFIPVDESIAEVILLIGLAVGIDYSLFYLRREREERAAGRSEGAALEAAAATSGRAVLISGMTVLIAMAGMLFSGDKTFMSFSIGTMMVVAVAMIGSLTVLPAVLSKLGDRVEKGRVPFVHRLRRKDGDSRVWGAILDSCPPPAGRLGRRGDGDPPRPRSAGVDAQHGHDQHRRHLDPPRSSRSSTSRPPSPVATSPHRSRSRPKDVTAARRSGRQSPSSSGRRSPAAR